MLCKYTTGLCRSVLQVVRFVDVEKVEINDRKLMSLAKVCRFWQ